MLTNEPLLTDVQIYRSGIKKKKKKTRNGGGGGGGMPNCK